MRVLVVVSILAAAVGAEKEAPSDYIVDSVTLKAYKVMYQAQTWSRALQVCEELGATLAVPKSQEEFVFLQKLVRGMYYPHITGTRFKQLVWVGINNIEDYTIWRNIDGENINNTGFHTWATSDIGFSANPAEPHCAGIDPINPGLRDYWCHLRQPYICQIRVEPYRGNEELEHPVEQQTHTKS